MNFFKTPLFVCFLLTLVLAGCGTNNADIGKEVKDAGEVVVGIVNDKALDNLETITYSNKELGISFDYPKDWFIIENEDSNSIGVYNQALNRGEKTTQDLVGMQLYFNITEPANEIIEREKRILKETGGKEYIITGKGGSKINVFEFSHDKGTGNGPYILAVSENKTTVYRAQSFSYEINGIGKETQQEESMKESKKILETIMHIQ